MTTRSVYEYSMELSYVDGSLAYPIKVEYIKSLIIDYDFVNNISPIAYLSINLDLDLYNKMVTYQGYNNVLLIVKKFIADIPNTAKETYIKKQLRYFFPKKDIDLEDKDISSDKREINTNAYKRCIIGLIDMDAISANRCTINQMYKNTTLEAIIHKYTNIPIIKEPFDNNPSIKSLVIPPTETVSGLLKYLNQRYCFYKSDFRLFFDYSYNCLISNKGSKIDVKDGSYPNVLVTITSQINDQKNKSNIDGLVIDPSQQVYMVQVNANQFDIDINRSNTVNATQIQTIGTDGTSSKSEIDYEISNDIEAGKPVENGVRNKVVRMNDTNPEYANVLSRIAYSEAVVVSISKANIDNSVLVPYKKYSINFPDKYAGYKGNYILIAKKEYYARVNETNFRCITMATFRRAE